MHFSVPFGQKWEFFEFDGKYLKLGCPVAPRTGRHLLFSTSLGVRRSIFGVFMKKIERDKTNFLAPIKKSFFCLCQFRLFFFFLTFTGGNPWPNTVPANPFGRKSGVFFCLQIEKVLCFLTSFSYTCTEFFFLFGSSFHKSFKFFGQNGLQTYKGTTSSMLLLRSCVFFYFFCRLSWNVLCSIHLKLLKSSKL